MKERCPLNAGPGAILTTRRLGAGAVCKLKKKHKAGIKNTTGHSVEQEVRHKALPAVHLSVCAVRELDERKPSKRLKSTIN